MQKKKPWGNYRNNVKVHSYFKEIEKNKIDGVLIRKPLLLNMYHRAVKAYCTCCYSGKYFQKPIKSWKHQTKKKKQWMK